MNPVPGVTGFGTGHLTATASPDGPLWLDFFDETGRYLHGETVPAGETRTVAERGAYMRPSYGIPVPIRRRDPADAAARMRAGYRGAGIPEDLAEALIEAMLADD